MPTHTDPLPQMIYTMLVSFYTLLLENEWSAPLNKVTAFFGHALNIQIVTAVMYMLLLDADMITGEPSVYFR